ncbi:MAG: YlqD family protein [Bacillota bacterium]
MFISRPVSVKSRITASLRAQLGAEVQKAILELDQELARLGTVEASGGKEVAAQVQRSRQELLQRKEQLMRRLREIANLKDGQEITRGQVQGIFELRVGDLWSDLETCEIVLQDDVVIAIRQGRSISVSLPQEVTSQEREPEE